MNLRRPQLLLALLVLAAPGCMGVPEPVPIPAPDGRCLRASPASDDDSEGPVHLVGLPHAVSRAGLVSVERDGQRFNTRSTAAGSFSLALTARVRDVLLVRLEDSEPTSYQVQKHVGFVNPSPQALPGVPPLSGPVSGLVTVRGASLPGAATFVVNMTTGEVATTTADASAAFTLTIGAELGHLLRVYIDTTPLCPPWDLTVE